MADCGRDYQQPNLSLTLAGHDLEITANEYIIEHEDCCTSAVLGLDLDDPVVILGNAFL